MRLLLPIIPCWVLSCLLPGCFYVTQSEQAARWDSDQDGIWRPDDCDDTDGAAGLATTWYDDGDGDGFGVEATAQSGCGPAPPGLADAPGDCDDGDREVYPGAAERCNGADDDCDNEVDEGLGADTWYPDGDGDTWGTDAGAVSACSPPAGHASRGGDCDDTLDAVHPEALEVCNGIDDDCDGDTDAADASLDPTSVVFRDQDGDGYGRDDETQAGCPVPGWVADGGDCDDAEAAVNPGEPERCDLFGTAPPVPADTDCDGALDVDPIDGDPYHRDGDGDGYGDGVVELRCTPSGWLPFDSVVDCDDTRAWVHPNATEWCNGRDDDCNTYVDDACVTDTGGTGGTGT